jgi:formamidopyrimidine-DNA glycosylase
VPELPDVEGARRLVDERATGARIVELVGPDPSVGRDVSLATMRRALRGRRVEPARRHGKWLVVPTDGPALVLHLGMTGQLDWATSDVPAPPFLRLAVVTDRGELRFADRRRLGGAWLAADDAELATILGDLGPDALGLRCADLARILGRRRKGLKVTLMDQSVIAGVGNMLSDEVCWRARLHPTRRADRLNPVEVRRLCDALRAALRAAVRAGRIPRTRGWLSSQRDASDPRCPRCSAPLTRSTVGGRASLWCPSCQPLPAPVTGARAGSSRAAT